jgi:hypothetical protein
MLMSDSFNTTTSDLWHIENCLGAEEEFTLSDETEGARPAVSLRSAEVRTLGGHHGFA